MWLLLLTYHLATLLLSRADNPCFRHSTFRSPANSDIEVICGAQMISLHILLCPIYFRGYNESLLSLNSQHSNQACKGTADWAADPPVVKFNFSITNEGISDCDNKLAEIQEPGTGHFSQFSYVQYINISGMACTKDPLKNPITYHQEVMYKYSCRYPLQYFINNTQMSVRYCGISSVIVTDEINAKSGANLVIKDNNGSFISTLSMGLYADNSYSSSLLMPQEGLELKTRIFVEVRASNLSNRFNVLLDRCYVTASPFIIDNSFHDLFVGCDRDIQTIVAMNGDQQEARFSFEAFRFIENTDDIISTYYVHCATRLCVNSICPALVQNCTSSRRRRSSEDNQDTTVSDSATITSGPIYTKSEKGHMSGSEDPKESHHMVVVVSVIAGIIGLICLTLIAVIALKTYSAKNAAGKTILCTPE